MSFSCLVVIVCRHISDKAWNNKWCKETITKTENEKVVHTCFWDRKVKHSFEISLWMVQLNNTYEITIVKRSPELTVDGTCLSGVKISYYEMMIIWSINDMFVHYWFTSVEQILVPVCDSCNMCYSRLYLVEIENQIRLWKANM